MAYSNYNGGNNNGGYGNNNGGGYNNNNGSNGNGENKPKTNFRVGRVYGSDGTLDINVWNSGKGGVYTTMSIKASVGNDPSSGAQIYEQKMASELPSICFNTENLKTLIEGLKSCDDLGSLDATIDTKRGAKLVLKGNGNNIVITIDTDKKGSRKITLEAFTFGNKVIHSSMLNIIQYLEFGYKKAITSKLDPEEFAMAVGCDNNQASDEEVPF